MEKKEAGKPQTDAKAPSTAAPKEPVQPSASDLTTPPPFAETKAKAEADSESQINQQVAQEAQAEQNSIRDQYQPMVFNGMDGTPMISGAKFNGEDVFVTALLPDGSAVIQKPGEEKTVVRIEETHHRYRKRSIGAIG